MRADFGGELADAFGVVRFPFIRTLAMVTLMPWI